MEIKEKITFKDFLHRKNITVYSLSKATGIPRTTIIDWKNNKRNLLQTSLLNLIKLSNYFNCSVEELLEELYYV
ncbi:helix-turn-helix transcriptional regulator [Anaerofustis butyriciformans]|uniref:helix-turn-helix domain-containing protein n=1 Tax=Anaerofustis butyriciformans TaxID=3108533 RepID=UPI002E2F6324|nr:helix-turn-helix transcriptional regulator [Anaerofustis sp. HA2171]